MKKLLPFILILSAAKVQAADNSTEFIYGSLTYHVLDFGVPQYYTHKLSSDGRLIANTLVGMKHVEETDKSYNSIAGFVGNNSIGNPIMGILYSDGLKYHNFYIGGVVGGYIQDDRAFYDKHLIPFPVIMEIDGNGVVPLVGLEINYRINLSHCYYIKLNNMLSPVITNHSVSVGAAF